jgi:AAA+ ATPase superfamily predicted ATPase
MTSFVGRKKELKLLEQLSKTKANLVVIKGRRRIGKSRFVEEFARDKEFVRFSGIPPEDGVTAQMQREVFAKQLSRELSLPYLVADDWASLFEWLFKNIQNKPYVILFDEISWMGSKDPTFLGKLKNAWDIYLSKIDGLVVILCGSVSTWIEENIVKSTTFFGRISLYIRLDELSISESNLFLEQQGFKRSVSEKFKLLSALGGVPWYLEQINGKLSADENLKNLFFTKNSALSREFDLIFHDLFGNRGEIYKKIIELLSSGPADINKICEKLSYTKSGAMSKYLDNLIEASFLSRDFTWSIKSGEISRLSQFRLSDNYLRFYMKYVMRHEQRILQGNFGDISMSTLPEWNSVMGLQFENLVLKNRIKIQEYLGIKAQDIVSDNPFFQRKTAVQKGCQIDYLIQTRFNTLFVCEIKFSSKEIKSDIIDSMHIKLASLVVPRGFACLPVLIHIGGVDDRVVDAAYFTEIIDFSDLLEERS